jgi:hypothetical protein
MTADIAPAPAPKMRDTTINYSTARPMPRASNDWYVEPRESVEALLRAERFSGLSWDPACGSGVIPSAMEAAGLEVDGSDVVDRLGGKYPLCDFLTDFDHDPAEPIANIVTNPPFFLARQFVDKALTIASHKVAMLLPITFLEGQARAKWLATTPLARVHVFSWRISMPPGELLTSGKVTAKGGKKCFAWFVFEIGHVGPPTVHLLTKLAGNR